jgi:hypothetical protein
MSAREIVQADRGARSAVQSFEGREDSRQASRLRLTAQESRFIRYVLSDWDGDAGAGSNMGAQLERLAQRPDLAPRRSREDYADVYDHSVGGRAAAPSPASLDSEIGNSWRTAWRKDQQDMYVHAPVPMARPDQILPQERWADMSTGNQRFLRNADHPNWCRSDTNEHLPGECDKILRAYRALLALWRAKPVAFAVIASLYGDLPPGLPAPLWMKSGTTNTPSHEDLEYRRVCRYVPGTGGSALHLEESVRVDRQKRKGETLEAHRVRVQTEQSARYMKLLEVGKACELAIVSASLDYRAAWRAAA